MKAQSFDYAFFTKLLVLQDFLDFGKVRLSEPKFLCRINLDDYMLLGGDNVLLPDLFNPLLQTIRGEFVVPYGSIYSVAIRT